MTETTINKVAELYKNKSDLFKELSIILDEDKSNFKISYERFGIITGNIIDV